MFSVYIHTELLPTETYSRNVHRETTLLCGHSLDNRWRHINLLLIISWKAEVTLSDVQYLLSDKAPEQKGL